MDYRFQNFIQTNSPDGGFLQSEYWKEFQASIGRKAHMLSAEDDGELIGYANIITHSLPIVGSYFYVPRGPVAKIFNFQFSTLPTGRQVFNQFLNDLISNAKKNDAGWIRIEPANEKVLNLIKENLHGDYKIKKSSVDMQPREILVIDISEREEEILARMKQKTRYNIRLAEKKGVKIFASREEKYIEEFLRLVRITAIRDKITSHPEKYYRKMFETIPPEILKLYVAEYKGRVIAANLVLFFGKVATYMHGASDNSDRDVMAPYFLQWQQIVDAKKAGCERYDFGGVKVPNTKYQIPNTNSWAGITKFKTGFAPETKPIQFPGCYDIILNSKKYFLYRFLQKIKRLGI